MDIWLDDRLAWMELGPNEIRSDACMDLTGMMGERKEGRIEKDHWVGDILLYSF